MNTLHGQRALMEKLHFCSLKVERECMQDVISIAKMRQKPNKIHYGFYDNKIGRRLNAAAQMKNYLRVHHSNPFNASNSRKKNKRRKIDESLTDSQQLVSSEQRTAWKNVN